MFFSKSILGGCTWFRRGEIAETATGQATDLISAKYVNAENADTFEFGALSFTGNTVGGEVAVAA